MEKNDGSKKRTEKRAKQDVQLAMYATGSAAVSSRLRQPLRKGLLSLHVAGHLPSYCVSRSQEAELLEQIKSNLIISYETSAR